MMRRLALLWLAIMSLVFCEAAMAQPASFDVHVTVDAAKTLGPVNPVWRFFGGDEPNYATMKDGRTTLATLGSLAPNRVYFRTHNLLTSGDGTPALKWGSTNVYTEDANGRPIYDWTIVDHIFDTYRARKVKPYVEIGFMPEALSTHPQPYQHDFRPGSGDIKTGWAYPPKDYDRWEELIYQWARHCVERYGRAEVSSWYFETGTRPTCRNIIGAARPRISSGCTMQLFAACGEPCPRRGWAGQTLRVRATASSRLS